jgi:23S rRNA (cytosine1962-C5)-methyltransferase
MDFLFADKPPGVLTNAETSTTRTYSDGFAEYLSERLDTTLFAVHRLDRDTTGALCFAKTQETAENLRQLFATQTGQIKRHLFLTDQKSAQTEFVRESFIETRKNETVSLQPDETSASPINSRTRFRIVKEISGMALWEAFPETGKSHQIRLHAQDAGIPILGDNEHGGSKFPTLCLHAEKLSFEFQGQMHSYQSVAPRWFEDLTLTQDPLMCRWLAAIERRERLARSLQVSTSSETLRWIHSEGDPLRAEQLGDVVCFSWFDLHAPREAELASIAKLAAIMKWEKWYIQVRENRGQGQTEEVLHHGPLPVPTPWTANENGLRFEFRTDRGLSPGLFLDQRRNRSWLQKNAAAKTVLNLFSYTGGFSVAAARGGAKKTVSVDLSKPFLEWTKVNFALNELSLEGHEFRAMDSREYLQWAKKKGLQFDTIICDPPSFSRSKSGVFRIEQDFAELLQLLVAVTALKGRILLSINFEKWTETQFMNETLKALKSIRRPVKIEATPDPDWDFELPSEAHNMKSLFLALQ